MTLLEQIRESNPALALIPDDELIENLLEQYQGDLDPDTFMRSLTEERPVESPVESPTEMPTAGKRPFGVGADPDDIGYGEAFVGGVKSMWERTWGPNITYLRGGIAGLMGDEEKAAQLYEQARQQDQAILNKTGYLSFEQATKGPDAGVDTFVKWGLQQAGMSLPYTLMGGVGGLAGRAALKGVMGSGMGAFTGATTTFVPQTAAFNIARQQEQVEAGNLDEVNEGAAFALALPSAMLEGALYPVLGKLFGPLGRTQFSNILNQASLGRVAKGSAIGAGVEALTEVGQQAIERYQAGLELDSEDALREYKEAAAGAAFVGGLFGGVTTTAGEAIRTVQPTPKVEEGIQQKAITKPEEVVQPEDQKTAALDQAKVEQEKPLNFAVEKQGDKFVVNRQELDEAGNVAKQTGVGVFNTEEEAKAKQVEIQDQKSKLPEQSFFTKDEIIKENPALGTIITDLENQGNKIAPQVQQVYFTKNLALPKGDTSNVVASGGTAGSVADGWYDRVSDLAYISLADTSKAMETTAHENFHALQRQLERGKQGLFKEEEQTALNTFLPGGKITDIAPSVQKGLGKDVMARLQERHGDTSLSSPEMQAYAFGAYSALKAQGKRMAAPNPVIRAFKKLWDVIKSAGNVFKKNEVNTVQDLFEKARTGEIGKRAVPKEGVEELRPKAIAAAEKAAAKGVVPDKLEYSLTTGGMRIKSIAEILDSPNAQENIDDVYDKNITGSELRQRLYRRQKGITKGNAAISSDVQKLLDEEASLIKSKQKIYIVDPVSKRGEWIGHVDGPNIDTTYSKADKELLGTKYARILDAGGQPELALSRVEFREQIRNNDDSFGKKYKLKTALSDGLKENLSKIGIALDKEHAETYRVINQTPRFVKGKIAEEDQQIFNDAVEAGYQEVKYQLGLGGETAISGTGWYNKAITDTIERVKDILPQMREGSVAEQTDKELQFKLFLALFSPQGGPTQNLDVATQVFKEYLETGKAVTKKSLFVGSPKFGVSHQSMVSSLKLVDYLSKKHGKKPGDLKNYLFSTQTYKQLGKEKLDSGFFKPAKNQKKQELDYSELSDVNKTSFNSETGKMEDSILMPAYMFGEKVGTFFLNFNGIEGVTKDRWFSRHFYRQFGQVGIARNPKTGKPLKSETKMVKDMGGKMVERTYPPGHDPVTKLRDTPKANDRKVMELYVEGVKQKAIDDGLLKGEDATKQNVQAILWYFEQGLYTDLGLKSVPIDYVQAVEVLENKIKNDIQIGGQSYGQFYDTKSVKGTATDVKTKSQEEEYGKLKEKEKRLVDDWEGPIEQAPEEIKSTLLAEPKGKSLPKNEFSLSKPTLQSIQNFKTTVEKVAQKSKGNFAFGDVAEWNKYSKKQGSLFNHCKACAMAVREFYGGEIVKTKLGWTDPFTKEEEKARPHFFNKIDDTYVDISGEQFGYKDVIIPQEFLDKMTKIVPDTAKGISPRFQKFINAIKEEPTAPELSVSEGQNQYQFEDTELSVSNRPGSYKGSIKISNDIPNSLKNKIKKDVGGTDVMQKAYNPESELKKIIYLLGNKLEENYKGFKSKFQTDYMIGVVTSNKYTDPNNKNVSQIKYFATDESDNLIGAAQGEIALYPKRFDEYAKINKIDTGDDVFDEAYELYEKRRENEDSKFFTKALELKQGGSYNVRATGLLTDELIKYAKSNDIQYIVLSDVLNEQAVRAFTKKGFSQAKRNSPFYGQKTITSGIRGRQEIRAINLVAEVDSLTPELSVSENLEDVIAPELSTSTERLDGVVTLDFADKKTGNFYDITVGDLRNIEIDSGQKLKSIKLLPEKDYTYGDGTGRFAANINVDGETVGYVVGAVTENDTAYIANVRIRDAALEPYASVSLWKQVAKQFKDKFGVKKFSGQRITGARRKFGVVADEAFVTSPEFSVSEEDIKVANQTSRTKGAVGEQAIVPKWIEENVNKKSSILDYGAGKSAQHTERLSNEGYNVTAYEFGDNVNPNIHDVNALDKKYDVVYASNVLNVQNSEEILNTTLKEISDALNENGYAIVNLPTTPRKGFYEGLTPSQGVVSLEEKLRDYIGDIQRVGGIPSAPIYKVEKVSQDKKIKYGLEFSASTRKYTEGQKRFISRINPRQQRKTIAGQWKGLTDNFSTKSHQYWVDQYSSVKKYIGEEPYKFLTMTHSSSGALEGALNYGVPFMDKDGAIDLKEGTLGTGLFTRFEKLGQDLPDFLHWVAANRAKYLQEQGFKTGLGTREDILEGTRLNKGREKLFNQALKDLNEFRNAFLQIGLKSGYLSQRAYNEWTGGAGYNFYLPFYRLLDDPKGTSGPLSADGIIDQPELKKYKGSDLPVQDLFSNMLLNFNFLAEASLKNQAGLKTLEQGETMGVTRKVSSPTKDSVYVRKNGRQVHYEVDEPLVLQALQALNWNGWQNPAMNALRNFKRYLTIGVTASPAFRIRNLIRDSVHAIAVGKLKYNPLNNVMQGGKAFSLKGRKMSEVRAKMAFGGGEIHFGHIYGGDPKATQMLLDRNIDLNTVMPMDGWGKGSMRFFKSKLGKGLDWWQEVGNTAENVNRSALYQQLRAKGVSHFEASYQARDLLNFSRHGAGPAARFLTQSVAFLNARIQGLDKLGRAMSKEQRAQLLTVLGAYSLASVGLYLAFKDDEDFKQREQWDRDTYHWFKWPGSETAWRIPKPFEVGAIGTIFERMAEQIVDDDVHGDLFRERAWHVITETFAFDARPQLMTPLWEVYANKDSFTDRPIEPLWMERLPPSERKYAYTSQAYVTSSKILSLIPWKKINFSPVQLEHIVEGYFGWVGSTAAAAVSITDYPRNAANMFRPNSPLYMGFKVDLPNLQSKYKSEFYDMMTQMNEVMALMRLYQRNGDTEKAMRVYNKNKNLLMWRSTYNKVNSQLQAISRQIKFIEAQKNMTEGEKLDKVRQLNLLKNEIVKTLKEQVLAFEKNNDTRVKRQIWWK